VADNSLAIFEKIAAALAESQEPDLSPFDPSEVRTALERVLQFPVPRQNFLIWLNGRIQVLSDGKVSIEERPSEDQVEAPEPAQSPMLEMPVRVLVEGEPFAEPAVVRAEGKVVHFPMRG